MFEQQRLLCAVVGLRLCSAWNMRDFMRVLRPHCQGMSSSSLKHIFGVGRVLRRSTFQSWTLFIEVLGGYNDSKRGS